jgi:hypothetical protein
MGSLKDVMILFAERDIRQMFSEYDGWKVTPLTGSCTAGWFYRVTRVKWVGEETAVIAVSFDQVPPEAFISALDSLPNGQGSRTQKYLLTPQATDTSGVPPHIRVRRLNAFAFDGGNLVWLTKKKNAVRYPRKVSAPV